MPDDSRGWRPAGQRREGEASSRSGRGGCCARDVMVPVGWGRVARAHAHACARSPPRRRRHALHLIAAASVGRRLGPSAHARRDAAGRRHAMRTRHIHAHVPPAPNRRLRAKVEHGPQVFLSVRLLRDSRSSQKRESTSPRSESRLGEEYSDDDLANRREARRYERPSHAAHVGPGDAYVRSRVRDSFASTRVWLRSWRVLGMRVA